MSVHHSETVAEELWRGAATCLGPALECDGDSVCVCLYVCVCVCGSRLAAASRRICVATISTAERGCGSRPQKLKEIKLRRAGRPRQTCIYHPRDVLFSARKVARQWALTQSARRLEFLTTHAMRGRTNRVTCNPYSNPNPMHACAGGFAGDQQNGSSGGGGRQLRGDALGCRQNPRRWAHVLLSGTLHPPSSSSFRTYVPLVASPAVSLSLPRVGRYEA